VVIRTERSHPPIEELSHLIAVGPGLVFGEYGHEGTGVKPRGDSPYLEHDVTTQVLALRMEPGEYYDTYYAYYLDPETEQWGFWGAGKKYNDRGTIRYLTTGAFVEQPGVPARQRSNHVMREVHFGGWLMDKQGQWYNIDRMVPGGSLSTISFKNWGVTEENEFYMQMGGFGENDHQPNLLELDGLPPVDERPVYLQPEMLEALYRLPATIDTLAPAEVGATRVVVQFDIADAGTDAVAELFWGTSEGLTFDYEWAYSREVEIAQGVNEIEITGLTPNQQYHYRLRIANAEGTTWSMHTQRFETAVPEEVYADFEIGSRAVFTGQSVVFTNKSFPEDASFQWSFPGGTPSSSVQRHPVVTYHTSGVYDVSLTVTDGSGKQDTKLIRGCISVSKIQEGEGLDVYLDFQSNLFDLSGNAYHGSPNFPMVFVDDDERGWVASFDGQTEVELTDYYGISGSDSRSMTAWIRSTHRDQVIVNWGRAQAAKKNTFKIDVNGYLRFEVAVGFIIASTTRVDNGEWHHIACVFESNGDPDVEDVKLYVNGQLEEAIATPQALDTETFRQATIGNDFFNKTFQGLMSDVRIYSRALSAEEVNTLAEDGEIDTSTPPLVKADNWVTVRALPGQHHVEINLNAATDALVSVFDLSGVLIKRRRISSGTTSLYRPQGNRIAVLLIQHNDHQPYAEKVFW
jgi:PKD repeat protein